MMNVASVKRMALLILAGVLVFFVATAALGYLFDVVIRRVILEEDKPEERLQEQLTAALGALRKDSRQAIQLLARLQREMAEIETKLRELRQQRAVLELPPEQREAIKGFVRRPESLRELLTSLDFWVGQVALNAFFFGLGLVASWLGRRRTPDGP